MKKEEERNGFKEVIKYIVFAVNKETKRRIALDGELTMSEIDEIIVNPKYKDLTIQGLPTNRMLDGKQLITFKK